MHGAIPAVLRTGFGGGAGFGGGGGLGATLAVFVAPKANGLASHVADFSAGVAALSASSSTTLNDGDRKSNVRAWSLRIAAKE